MRHVMHMLVACDGMFCVDVMDVMDVRHDVRQCVHGTCDACGACDGSWSGA